MAEPQANPAEGEGQRPPSGGNGNDQGPVDWQARAAEAEKKLGQLVNENKRIKAARDDIATNVKRWSGLEEAGYTPEQIQEMLGKQEKDALDQARDKGEIDKLLENQRKTLEKQRSAVETQLEAERRLNNEVLLDSVLMQELAKVCDPDLLEGAFALHRPKIVMIEDPESKYGRKAVATVGGDQMEVADFVKNWAETNEKALKYLKPSLAGGGGAGGGANARMRTMARKDMTPKQKSDYITQFGKAAYDALPWQK